jgi:alkylation response protein AidB-like acyl-CoA dehydrogenase
MFVVDMGADGVTVSPLRQMTGGASFNSVHLDAVRISDYRRLGEAGEGWRVAQTTLMNERASIGAASRRDSLSTTRLLELIERHGDGSDLVTRQQMASVYIHAKVASYTSQRIMERIRSGQTPGAESSIVKLMRTRNLRRLSDMLSHVLGQKLVADSGEWGTYAWSEMVLGIPGTRIAGGTDEIMKNILAERVLGLPRDPMPRGA